MRKNGYTQGIALSSPSATEAVPGNKTPQKRPSSRKSASLDTHRPE